MPAVDTVSMNSIRPEVSYSMLHAISPWESLTCPD